MATTTTLATNLHLAAGSTTFPNPSTTPGGVAPTLGELILAADTSKLSNTTTITVALEATTDGGATWQPVASFTFPGGTYTNRQGQSTGVHQMATDWQQIPDAQGAMTTPNGHVVVTMSAAGTVTNVTLTN